ncbi:flagellar protein FlgN [Clostridium rectalis]|uniref:flagellar protein FlgN n=1 Tax=Clostridium rectalis TaxID=2040295 RepID=UPI000F63AAC5|nr:flagellar protein FlgN [Clostridium rectalis]
MYRELSSIMKEEITCLEKLLKCLERQHEYIAKNEVFKMEAVIKEIEDSNREIAKWEIKRRKLTNGEAMSKIVQVSKDENLEEQYMFMKKFVEELKLQKELNEMLIRQGLGYTTRMLKILNPDRTAKTYSSYGKMR